MPPEPSYWLKLASSLPPSVSPHSRLLFIGPHLTCLQCFPGQRVWCSAQGNTFSHTGHILFKPAGGILHDHPVLGALAGRRRCHLQVPKDGLQATQGTAEAHRGRAQGDHDVLAARCWRSGGFGTNKQTNVIGC